MPSLLSHSCCSEPYPDITFRLHFRRDPGFFAYNIIMPTLALLSLAILTFLLPAEIGERISVSIQAFLAMSLIMLMVIQSIPVTSDSTPIVSKMILLSLFHIGFVLLANCISLCARRTREVPSWIRVVVLQYIAHLQIGRAHV